MGTQFEGLSDDALVHGILQADRDAVGLKFRHVEGRLDDTTLIRQKRKEIARMRTELRSRELAQGLRKDALLDMHRKSFSPSAGSAAAASGGSFLEGVVDKLDEQE